MKQKAHAWVALRALKLLDDSGQAPKLVNLVAHYVSDAWDGAWLPDTLIKDMSYGHIYKMESDTAFMPSDALVGRRLRVPYNELRKKLKGRRMCDKGENNFIHVTNCIFHDAVQSVASLWLKAWQRYSS